MRIMAKTGLDLAGMRDAVKTDASMAIESEITLSDQERGK